MVRPWRLPLRTSATRKRLRVGSAEDIDLQIASLPKNKKSLVLLLRRWGVERSVLPPARVCTRCTG